MIRLLLSEHDHRGLSITRLIRVRARILAKFVWDRSRQVGMRGQLHTLRRLRGTGRSREALVLGLGPSLNRLDTAKIKELQGSDELSVFAVNAYALTELGAILEPDHYVLTDPAYFGGSQDHYKSTSRADPGQVWDYIRLRPHMTVYVPLGASVPDGLGHIRLVRCDTSGLQGFTRSVAPIRARGYISITAYLALAIAGWLEYSRILILGIDNTQFRSMVLSKNRGVALRAAHAYTTDDGAANEIEIFRRGGVAAFFEDVSRLFADLRLFAHLPIENLDRQTLVDAFPIADDADVYVRS